MSNNRARVALCEFADYTKGLLVGHIKSTCVEGTIVHAGVCAHKNPGDNAISVAEAKLIAASGKSAIRRYSDLSMMSSPKLIIDEIKSLPNRPAIILSGGGFLTALYPEILESSTNLIREFTDRQILVMPQSSSLDDSALSKEFVAAVRYHPRIRILARDDKSLAELSTLTSSDVQRAPDAVLSLGPTAPNRTRRRTASAIIAREDGEVMPGRGAIPPLPVLAWMTEPRAYRDPRLLPARLQARSIVHGRSSDRLMLAAAHGRMQRALSMVRSTEVLVTDRLHGLILALLVGTPVVAVDNSYGKIRALVNTWRLHNLGVIRMADSFPEAAEIARLLPTRSSAQESW